MSEIGDRIVEIDGVLERANAPELANPEPGTYDNVGTIPPALVGEVVELEAHIEIPMGLLTERIGAAAEARKARLDAVPVNRDLTDAELADLNAEHAEARERDAAEPVVTLESVPPDPSVPIPKHLSLSARERDAIRDPDHLVAPKSNVRVLRERPTAREAARVESTMMAGLDGLAVKLRVPFDPNAPLQLHFLPEMFLAAIAQKAKTTHNVIVKKACVDFLEAAASYASRMIVELDRRRITMEAQRERMAEPAPDELPDSLAELRDGTEEAQS